MNHIRIKLILNDNIYVHRSILSGLDDARGKNNWISRLSSNLIIDENTGRINALTITAQFKMYENLKINLQANHVQTVGCVRN